jgi:hypothetical protein
VLKDHWKLAGRTLGERGGPINYSDVDADELVPQLAQLVAFIQQRIRHGHRRQRPSEGGGNKLLDVSVPYF